jgi:pilus assembly protein TadC
MRTSRSLLVNSLIDLAFAYSIFLLVDFFPITFFIGDFFEVTLVVTKRMVTIATSFSYSYYPLTSMGNWKIFFLW